MDIYNLSEFTRGWIIGNFEPSLIKTDVFEVALLTYQQDEVHPEHLHKIATEYNILVSGEMVVNDKIIHENQVFIIHAGEYSRVEFLTDCKVVCVKIPSVPSDKYERHYI